MKAVSEVADLLKVKLSQKKKARRKAIERRLFVVFVIRGGRDVGGWSERN